ncbi:uncharacterized protein LOC117342952 [Pecten maximus]|uniref:uncharacterized protein LOC117342952 n=1 Tax=Pecten maximus TaxID=6579 RepID=UPI001458E29D|nr:uncharacterized protein LOC117342952 [Pecten maximus]
MRGLCVATLLLFFSSAVTAGGYGHGQRHHGNIYGHNIIRTFPRHQQYLVGRQRPLQHQFRYIAHQSPVVHSNVQYQGRGVVSTGLTSPFVHGRAPGTIGTSGALLQHPSQTILPTHSVIHHSTPSVLNNIGSPGMTFLTAGTQGIPVQSSTHIGTQSVSFQAPSGVPVSPQVPAIQTTNGLFPAATPLSPIGIQTGSPLFQNSAIGSQPTFGGVSTSVTGNTQNNVGMRDLGLNMPITSNSGFDSVPLAYEQEQNGLKSGVPALGIPFDTEEKVGIPKFGGWAPPSVNDVVIREDNTLPITTQRRSLASILRNFHMK